MDNYEIRFDEWLASDEVSSEDKSSVSFHSSGIRLPFVCEISKALRPLWRLDFGDKSMLCRKSSAYTFPPRSGGIGQVPAYPA